MFYSKKISIVIPVLNSHEVLRRQLVHWGSLPDDVEVIIVDDGSDPPIEYSGPLPVKIIRTHDKRPWTWALARNKGAREAVGEYLVMFDIDHIVTRETLEICRKFNGDRVYFNRQFGVLNEFGEFTQDRGVLEEYGLPKDESLKIGALPNLFCIRKSTFREIGGYREDVVDRPYPQGEDRMFKKALRRLEKSRKWDLVMTPAPIYMYPNGYYIGDVDADPKGLFHKLTRKTRRNLKWQT